MMHRITDPELGIGLKAGFVFSPPNGIRYEIFSTSWHGTACLGRKPALLNRSIL